MDSTATSRPPHAGPMLTRMASFDPMTWLAIGGVAIWTVVGVLYILAVRIGQETEIHDLMVATRRLHNAYIRRLRRGGPWVEGEVTGVDIVEEEDAAEAATQATAARKAA